MGERRYERVRTPSWVIGERLSGDGAVQSRPVMQAFRPDTPEAGGVLSYRQSFHSPVKTMPVLNEVVRSRAWSGDSAARRTAPGVRFEVTRVSEGDLDSASQHDFGWKSAFDLLSTASSNEESTKPESPFTVSFASPF